MVAILLRPQCVNFSVFMFQMIIPFYLQTFPFTCIDTFHIPIPDTQSKFIQHNTAVFECIDGLVQDCSICIINALEMLQPCTKPSNMGTT